MKAVYLLPRTLAAFGSLVFCFLARGQDPVAGHVVPSFNPASGAVFPLVSSPPPYTAIRAAAQSSGRILVWGGFTNFGGQAAARLARLNPDGSGDASFVPSRLQLIATNGSVAVTNEGVLRDAAVLADNRVLALGAFNLLDGTNHTGNPAGWDQVIRLDENGQYDPAFVLELAKIVSPRVGSPTVKLRFLQVAPDGSSLIAARWDDGLSVAEKLFRIETNGSVAVAGPVTFSDGVAAGSFSAAALLSDGNVITAQPLTTGTDTEPLVERYNGEQPDLGFLSPIFTNAVTRNGAPVAAQVNAIVVQADGKILVAGDFTHVDGLSRGGVVRLETNGVVDTTFVPGTGGNGTAFVLPQPPFAVTNGPVSTILIRPDGSLVVAGDFDRFDNQRRAGLVRLDSNGNVESGFDAVPGVAKLADAQTNSLARISSVALAAPDQLVVAGLFDAINGVARPNVALLADGPGLIVLNVYITPSGVTQRVEKPLLLEAVAVGDGPLTYQWVKDGVAIPGATNSVLYVPAPQWSDAGGYVVVVFSPPFLRISEFVVVSLLFPEQPVITLQPLPHRALLSQALTLAGAASGEPPLTYQWVKDGIALAGETNTTLTIPSVGIPDAGGYRLVAINSLGVAISDDTLLQVFDPSTPDATAPVVTVTNAPVEVLPVFRRVFVLKGTAVDDYYVDLFVLDELGSNRVSRYLGESPWTTPLVLELGTNRFHVFGRDLAGNTSATNEVILFYEPDTQPPVLTITSPVLGTNVTDDEMPVLKGTVTDADSAQVFVIDTNGVPRLAAGSTNWSAPAGLLPGTNVVRVYAQDPTGNRSETNSVVFVYTEKPFFRLTKLGLGDVRGVTNRQLLVTGRRYTVTATPKTGWLFRGWSGGLRTNALSVSFVATGAVMRVTAEFVTNTFPVLKGAYTGVIFTNTDPTLATMGDVNLTVTDRGAFTGRLRTAGGTHNLAGTFDPLTLESTVVVARTRTNSLFVRAALDADSRIAVVLVTNRDLVLRGELPRTFYSATQPVPTNLTGRFTAALLSQHGLSMGNGYATLNVARAGTVAFAGSLSDGTAFSASGPLAPGGHFVSFIPLYATKGATLANLVLPTTTNGPLTGQTWAVRPPKQPGTLYPAGFQESFEVIGGRYLPPKVNNRVLAFTNGVAVLEGGNLAAPAVVTNLLLSTANKVTVVGTNATKVALTLTTPSGVVAGSFTHPTTRRAAAIKGVILQNRNSVTGQFPGTNVTGQLYFGLPENYPLE